MADITQQKFDELCDAYDSMKYKCDDWFPTLKEIKTLLEPNIERDYKFALWILETSKPPQNEEEAEARRYLMSLVYKHLNIQ